MPRGSPVLRLPGATQVLALVLLLGLPAPAAGQAVPDALAGLDRANAEAWVTPFTRALAPALTAGFFTSGDRGEGLDAFHLALRVVAGRIPSGEERYDPVLPASVTFDGRTFADPYVLEGTAATVAGGASTARLVPRPGSPYESALDDAGVPPPSRSLVLPDGLDLSYAPLPVVEAALFLRGLGVQLVGRFTPTVELFDELGDVSAFGGGALVTVSRFLPAPWIDVGLSAVTQKVAAGDWLDASASAFGVVLSRDFGPVRPWVHGLLASSDVRVAYDVRNPDGLPLLQEDGATVRFRQTLEGRGHLAVGTALDLGLLSVAAEYQTGGRDVISLRATLVRR